jgi:hypothetical protein
MSETVLGPDGKEAFSRHTPREIAVLQYDRWWPIATCCTAVAERR